MTSLQFRYDGYKKPEQGRNMWGRNMCFFPPRYNYGGAEAMQPEEMQQEEPLPEEMQPEQNIPEKTIEKEAQSEEKQQASMKTENKPVNASEKLLENLTVAEANFSKLKERMDVAKTVFDKIIYKLDSMMQIVEIIRENEVKSMSESQIQTDSLKTTKDSVDELLELLQGPIFQNILRQFLLKVFIKDSDGTKSERGT